MSAVKFYKGIGEVFDNLSNLDEGTLYFIDHDTYDIENEGLPDISDIHPDSIWVGDSMVGSRYIEDLETRNGSTVSIHNLSCDGSITGLRSPTGVNPSILSSVNPISSNKTVDNRPATVKNIVDYVDGSFTGFVFYGTCETEAATKAKVVTISGPHQPVLDSDGRPPIGTVVFVKFANTNTASGSSFASSLTMKIGSGGMADYLGYMVNGDVTYFSSSYRGYIKEQCVYRVVFSRGSSGTYYWIMDINRDSNTTYTNLSFGMGFAPVSELGTNVSENDTIVATVNGSNSQSYTDSTAGFVLVKIPELSDNHPIYLGVKCHADTAVKKSIYYRGNAIDSEESEELIKEGDWCLFIYNGYSTGGEGYHLIASANDILELQSIFGGYLSLDGGTMAGNINMGNNSITNLSYPSEPLDAVNKNYVDGLVESSVSQTIYPSISEPDVPVYSLIPNLKEQFAFIQLVVDTAGNNHEIVGVNKSESVFKLGLKSEMRPNSSIRVYVYARPVIECWWKDGYGIGKPVMIPEETYDNTYPVIADDYIVNGERMDVLEILPDFDGGGEYDGTLENPSNDKNNTFIAGKPTHLVPKYNYTDAHEWIGNGVTLCLDHSTGRIGVGVLDIVYSWSYKTGTSRTLVIPVSGFTEKTQSANS
jgi:hypothetical protein